MKILKFVLTYLISALPIVVLSPDLLAQSVAMVPSNTWISKFNGVVNNVPNTFTQSTQFNFLNGQVVSDQVDFGGQFTVQKIAASNPGLFQLDVSLDQAIAIVKNLQIHVKVEQDLGFGSATVNIDAACAAVLVNIPSVQGLQVLVDRNFQVQAVNTNFNKLNLLTSFEGCTAIGGLEKEIQSRISAILKSQLFESEFKQILTAEIGKQINANIKKVVNYFVESKNSDVKVKLAIDDQNKLWIYAGENAETAFSNDDLATLSKSETSAALINKTALETSLLKNLNAQLIKNPVISKGNESLENLTCSRFVQFFVWPALKAFPKCFTMQLVSEIKELKLIDLAKLKFSVKANNWAQAKDYNRNIAYFNLDSEIALNPSKVKIKSIAAQHDPEFLKWSGRSSRISTGLVTSTLQEYLQTQLTSLIKANEMLNPSHIKDVKQLNAQTLLVQIKN